ncbi:MAG TPA: hypothetical protein VKN14_06750 [Flavobacteriaceae bacterium]|nr:hypothetical protein [Flavobacteriaceae bacterium]
MSDQEVVTFEGPLYSIFSTDKVVKFGIQDRFFIAFKKHVTLLKDYMTKDREGTKAKLILPIPATKSKDKQNNDREQFVLTDHTKIFLDDQLIFFPIEQVEDLALIEESIASAEELEKENELIVMEKQKNALANQKATPKQLSRSESGVDKKVIKEGGFYKVAGGKEVPDAPKIESEINKLVEDSGRVLNLIILDFGKDDEKAWARVRVEDGLTKQFKDDGVIHHYNTLQDAFLLDLITAFEEQRKDKWTKKLICPDNPIEGLDPITNKPLLTFFSKRAIIIRLLKFKQFAERDAITKAASRAYLKMLNREWRTKEEIEDELREVQLVNST